MSEQLEKKMQRIIEAVHDADNKLLILLKKTEDDDEMLEMIKGGLSDLKSAVEMLRELIPFTKGVLVGMKEMIK